MENLVIDDEYLNKIANAIETFCTQLKNDSETIKNEKEDIFYRYMAYTRLHFIINIFPPLINSQKNAFIYGHSLNEEIFQTQKWKEAGWDSADIESHPFFINKIDREDDDSEIPDVLKKMVMSAILEKLKKGK